MKPRKPSKFCLAKIKKLVVDTKRGQVWNESGTEIGTNRGHRKRIGMRNEEGKSICFYRYHVVWFFETGRWPRLELDHKNEKTWDDRFNNLQELTHAENCQRSKRSGLPPGIDRKEGKYRARYCRDGDLVIVGNFRTISDAVQQRRRAMT